ncbi:SDR family oxidoreductase [uncultured Jatrophihabitans sp.]|uniref:SDR family oxidoreductase n=1 Tax=uncultured Jatrophihabitans sp. TaxID=1610747 RepID=UPI0035C98C36
MPERSRILITGASSGLGEAMARRWAGPGRTLVLAARRRDRLDALAHELADTGTTVDVRTLDVTDPDSVADTISSAAREHGGLDRVVVNAGVGGGVALGTGRADVNRRTLVTNTVAAFDQADAAMSVFREQGDGHLVLVASVAGVRGLPGASSAYSASKAAVIALGQGLHAELVASRSRIRVTTVLPGFIATAINEGRRPPGVLTATLDKGADALVTAIDSERRRAVVPALPWTPIARLLPLLPDRLAGRAG